MTSFIFLFFAGGPLCFPQSRFFRLFKVRFLSHWSLSVPVLRLRHVQRRFFNDGSVSTLPQLSLFALPVPNPFESMDLVRASRLLQAPPPLMTFTAGFMQPPLQLQTISTDGRVPLRGVKPEARMP